MNLHLYCLNESHFIPNSGLCREHGLLFLGGCRAANCCERADQKLGLEVNDVGNNLRNNQIKNRINSSFDTYILDTSLFCIPHTAGSLLN